jgi:chromosome segregation ATPase
MSEEQAPYRTSTSATTLAQAAHACRERVLHVQGELNKLLSALHTGTIDERTAQERRERLTDELRAAADELERSRLD